MELYIIRRSEKIIGIFDDPKIYFPELSEDTKIYKNHIIEKLNLNEITIKPNQIIYKSSRFNINNLDDPLLLVDVTETEYL